MPETSKGKAPKRRVAKTAKAAARPRRAPAARAGGAARAGMITILQYRSGIGCNVTHKRVLRSLGLRHPHQTVVRPDNPAVRGMVLSIPHLVRIVEPSDAQA